MWNFLAPVIGAVASGIIGNKGSEDRNDAQIDQAQATNQFNAEQAQITRDFNAAQAGISREWSAEQASRAMDFSGAQAQQQMDFQREMSGTSYQRAIADLQQAGLNPMLAYSQGGSSTPGGASGSSSMGSSSAASGPSASGTMANLENELGPVTFSALAAAKGIADIEKTSAETDEVRARTVTEKERPEEVRRHTLLLNQQVHESIARTHLTHDQAKHLQEQVNVLKEEQGIKAAELMLKRFELLVKEAETPAQINQAVAEAKAWASEYGQSARPYVRDFQGGASGAASILNQLRRFGGRR